MNFPETNRRVLSKLYSDYGWIYEIFYEKYFNYPEIALLVEKHLKKYGVKTILHIGSGPGHLTKLFVNKWFDVVGLDNSKEMIEMAREIIPNIRFIKADMRKIKSKGKFDAAVLMGRTFTHIVTNKDILDSLKCFRKILKDNGILLFDNFKAEKMNVGKIFNNIITIKNRGYKITRKSKLELLSKKPSVGKWKYLFEVAKNSHITKYLDENIIRAFSRKEISSFLKKSGFRLIKFAPNFDNLSFLTIARKI